MAANRGNVAAAILAGGLGTRLRPVVDDRPKVLATVQGRPFLAHLLERLAAASVRRVVLLTGYCSEQVRDALGETYAGVRLVYSAEPAPLGTAGAVRHALPLLAAPTVLLLNGDSCCDVSLAAFRSFQRRHLAEASLVLARVPDISRFGRVETGPGGLVRCFEEKGGATGRGWINAGVYLLDRALIEALPEGRPASLEGDLLPAWVAAGRVHGYRCRGRFLDIGTPESYAEADAFFRPGGPVAREHRQAATLTPSAGPG
jgi:NDP-sugar pyrophosphorylase family protein